MQNYSNDKRCALAPHRETITGIEMQLNKQTHGLTLTIKFYDMKDLVFHTSPNHDRIIDREYELVLQVLSASAPMKDLIKPYHVLNARLATAYAIHKVQTELEETKSKVTFEQFDKLVNAVIDDIKEHDKITRYAKIITYSELLTRIKKPFNVEISYKPNIDTVVIKNA